MKLLAEKATLSEKTAGRGSLKPRPIPPGGGIINGGHRMIFDAAPPLFAYHKNDAGVTDYSIFLDKETLTLFAVQKLADGHTADALPSHPIVRKWWDFMADIMEVNPDNSPVCKPLVEVFHAD